MKVLRVVMRGKGGGNRGRSNEDKLNLTEAKFQITFAFSAVPMNRVERTLGATSRHTTLLHFRDCHQFVSPRQISSRRIYTSTVLPILFVELFNRKKDRQYTKGELLSPLLSLSLSLSIAVSVSVPPPLLLSHPLTTTLPTGL